MTSSEVPNWIKPGCYIDAKDSMNDWCMALVKGVNSESATVTVNHDGWGIKCDSTYPFKSSKIAPFRKFTRGYTGPKRSTYRDWSFSEQEVKEAKEKVVQARSDGLVLGDAFETTQFYRGHLFVLVENLLSCNYTGRDEALPEVVEFFGETMKLIIDWLKMGKELFPEYYRGANNWELSMTDNQVALAMSWPELLDLLNRLFALEPRVTGFFMQYDVVPEGYEKCNLTDMENTRYSTTLLYLINLFAKEGGFDAILEIVKSQDENSRVPFTFANNILLYAISSFLDSEFSQNFFTEFTEGIFNRINTISEKELKDLKHEDILTLLHRMSNLTNSLDPEAVEVNKLNLFLKMLNCNYLEKRIKGLNEINSAIESLFMRESTFQQVTVRLSPDKMKNWLVERKVVELVLKDRPHVEIIKRSGTILQFLAKFKLIEHSHLEALWDSSHGKHDSLVRATYSTIKEITPLLQESHNEFLFKKMQEVPEYDENYLELVKDFSYKAIYNSYRKAQAEGRKNTKWYGVSILKELMLDSSSLGYWETSTKYLKEIVTMPCCEDLKAEILEEILDGIRNNDSVPQMLKLTMGLVKGSIIHRNNREVLELQQKHQIKELILENLIEYLDQVKALKQNEDTPAKIYKGRFSHETNIKRRLIFIEFLVNDSPGEIQVTLEEYKQLWQRFVKEASFEKDTDLFFEWLLEGIKSNSPLMTEQHEDAFKNFFLDPENLPAENIRETAFSTFRWLFLLINSEQGRVFGEKRFKCRTQKEIIGFERLVDFELFSKEESVIKEASKIIVGLLTRFDSQTLQEAENILMEFTNALVKKIDQNIEDESIVSKALFLVNSLLQEDSEEANGKLTTVYVKEVHSREFKSVQVDMTKNIRHLRKIVAKVFKQPLSRAKLNIHDKTYGAFEDDILLNKIKIYWLTVDFEDEDIEEFNPKQALSKDQELMECLFKLLSFSEKAYADMAWKLLMALPINERLEQELQSLETPLEQLIDQNSKHKLLYILTILDRLSVNSDWVEKFCEAGGLEFLAGNFVGEKDQETKVEAKYEALMIILLSKFTKASSSLGCEYSVFTKALLKGFLLVCKNIKEKYTENQNELFDALNDLLYTIQKSNSSVLRETLTKQIPECLEDLCSSILIYCPDREFSKRAKEVLSELASLTQMFPEFLSCLVHLIKTAIENPTEEYWELLCFVLKSQENHPSMPQLSSILLNQVKKRPGEKTSNEKDVVLDGVLMCLANGFENVQSQTDSKFVNLILHSCLFEIPESMEKNLVTPPKCKHSETRTHAFCLLRVMCSADPTTLETVTEYLRKFHQEPYWRTSKRADWHISPASKEKSSTGFVGLKNLGCTCYMNSVLQQLFMINSFREAILQSPVSVSESYEENILYQLQFIFSALKNSAKQYITPKSFTSSFKDFEGNPINVMEQMDADEFFSTFMDRIEDHLKGSEHEKVIKNHFGGLLVTEMIGKDCTHRSERFEPFITIPLEVKNKKSIIAGLESFVEGEILEGENAYQCDHCDAKVRALRRVCVKHLPNYLIVALRRFEFDFDTMNRHKLNDYCEFPHELDMEPYTQEGLERREKEMSSSIYPEDYYKYKLRGIVIHIGTAESGHYYSYIYDPSSELWYDFNDTWIRELDPEEIPKECFGGEEKWSWGGGMPGIREKFGNAYLLLYERKGIYKGREPEDENLESWDLKVKEAEAVEHLSYVKEQNQRYWRSRLIFSEEYAKFVTGITTLNKPPFKFLAEFLLTILIRSKEKKLELAEIYKSVVSGLENTDFALWLSELFSVEEVIKELMLYCPVHEIRSLLVGLINKTLDAVPSQTEDFFKRWIQLLPYATKRFTKNYAQYLQVVKELVLKKPSLTQDYKLVYILQNYMINQDYKAFLPETKPHSLEDIYLGYKSKSTKEENFKDETFFMDVKGVTLSHLFELFSLIYDEFEKQNTELMENPNLIRYLVSDLDSKSSAKHLGKLYAKVCKDNTEVTKEYLNTALHYYESCEYYNKPKYLKLFTDFLAEKDSLQVQKVEFFLENFLKIMGNSKYSSEVEIALNYLFKISTKIPVVLQEIHKKESSLATLRDWISKNMKVTYKTPGSYMTEESVRPTYKAMLGKCEKLIQGEPPNEEEPDSDQELTSEELQPGKPVDIADSTGQSWSTGKVLANLGEIICIEYSGYQKTYIAWREKQSEDIAPAGTKANFRSFVNF